MYQHYLVKNMVVPMALGAGFGLSVTGYGYYCMEFYQYLRDKKVR